ncbi:hypothetical protein PSAB6_10390 [Paraburkholderia sabiae]|nr:hypothetical protein PSAB6_10390 [Paraburkholderia sabiae]
MSIISLLLFIELRLPLATPAAPLSEAVVKV